ncbi:exodeoxyribonuclease VII large subunit [Tepidicaulis sp.]|uniref:exodeoxyribonuclease VII large subunit n=1 Tax=Tepidicaulis sp. TaxID=1920809 RepID=UPI003B5C017F
MSQASGPPPASNLLELTISELSAAIKRTVEDTFGHVRVRGEVGRVSRPGSGHVYLDLKDDRAVLSAVIWKGVVPGLKIKPEQGLEVIVTGRLTTFPGQSRYQIVIEQMEPAGVGALMALLEERKKKLGAEGLFAPERKKPLPFLPDVIGVVTSPSGAVIRDILHRLNDRFPRHVLIWPVRVQGEQSAGEVAAAIEGFNKLEPGGPVPRPDLLIVARGGGSIEDLWSFNEENVVRAAAASRIPLISAVGHETDTTLIDYAADRRAPTPTAAAEMAVPVRAELQAQVMERAQRLFRAQTRILEQGRAQVEGLARGLPRLQDLFALPEQRLDHASERLTRSLMNAVAAKEALFHKTEGRLTGKLIEMRLLEGTRRTADMSQRLQNAETRRLEDLRRKLDQTGRLLESFSYKNVLGRGFALVRDGEGKPVRGSAGLAGGAPLELEFAGDDRLGVVVAGEGAAPKPEKAAARKKSPPKKPDAKKPEQGSLL